VLVVDFVGDLGAVPCIQVDSGVRGVLAEDQPRGVEVLGVVMDSGSPDEILDFVRDYRDPLPAAFWGTTRLASDFGVNQGLPTHSSSTEGRHSEQDPGKPATKFEKLQETVDAARRGLSAPTPVSR